jgi:phosphoenolpyruvate carboxykinase (ATP)
MPLPPQRYADILKEKINKHNVKCWLVNTGWIRGKYGQGKRIPLDITRKIINLILDNEFERVLFFKHKHTGFQVPYHDYATNDIMFPEDGWQSTGEYAKAAKELMDLMESQ